MTDELQEFLCELEQYQPLNSYKFGHTPTQMAYFKTSAHQGCDVFEYWHQVLQLKSLRDSLEELRIQKAELLAECEDAKKLWPVWSYKKRKRALPRLDLKLRRLQDVIEEKTREAQFHYNLLKTKYADFENLSESQILSQDQTYWSYRLGRQLATTRLSRALGVGDGELAAVLALPQDEKKKVLEGMASFLNESQILLSE